MCHNYINIDIYFTGFYRQSQFSDIFQPLLNADKILKLQYEIEHSVNP